jgi:hypothetical protein
MKVTIFQDSDSESPRNWDNMGTMIAFHGRYCLGDEGHGFDHRDFNGWDELEAAIVKEHPGGVILPLYLFDHSGITMNTTGFHCTWDSGRVGFIVASAKAIREAFMVKRITKSVRERATASLVSEVKTYSQYIEGDVYGYTVEDDGDVVDSCSGFYGSDPFTNGMSESIDKEYHDALREAVDA